MKGSSIRWQVPAGIALLTAAAVSGPGTAEATTPERVARCSTDSLSVSLGPGEGAAGHFYVPVLFTNDGQAACRIGGHPDVAYFAGADRHQVGDAAARLPEPTPTVVLRTGQTATAWLDQVNVDNYDPVACAPTPVSGLRVYPPGDTVPVLLTEPNARGCARHMDGQYQLTIRAVRR
ncbi:Protein of unknown function [Amycolatopsis xylanica]|uniref:DUF4232 domain-containing protein n=1 Tax=Amycolatopsis xylanica TaxID=589385 RepID=A0A1H2WDW0_9PSEU|nr:DUF4232 domain-containing protein [Amycolatopsis xylanica]SDW78873.1 Protein of unknown function [Amycolatopsis xylanica]